MSTAANPTTWPAAARWRPRITHARPELNPRAAQEAAADLLTAPGLDLTHDHLADTPRRMAQALNPPGNRILGLSKFARMVDLHARQPQTQERLTKRVADHLQRSLDRKGVGVVIEAEHTCMSLRGARPVGARTVTSTLFGQLREDQRSRAEFLELTRSKP